MMTKKTVTLSFFAAAATMVSVWAAKPGPQLPPKQKKTQGPALGESKAVDEVKRLTDGQNSETDSQSTNDSGAVPDISISAAVVQAVKSTAITTTTTTATTSTTLKKKTSTPVAEKSKVDAPKTLKSEEPAQESTVLPQSRLWLVLDKKPELGFMSGWAFTRKELSTLVGDGFTYGFLAAQEIVPGVQAQIRMSGSHHREKTDTRKSSLNLFPFEVLAQFSRVHANFTLYVQPGLGGTGWNSKSVRLVDKYEQKAHGFDFMASGGFGFKYKTSESPWSIGADTSLAYVSGYFDNYFSRVLVYTTYQF
ncbi:MAG: hypothetical protein ABIR96_05955 [Bdellovibrionota bacterium]